MDKLGLELGKRDNELKRRRQEAEGYAEKMKVQYGYSVVILGPVAFIPEVVAQVQKYVHTKSFGQ